MAKEDEEMPHHYSGFTPYEGYEDMVVEKRSSGVVMVRLERPEILNALTPAMRIGLKRVFDEVRWDDEAKVILLTGTGRGFCSGANMGRGATPEPEPATRYEFMDPRYAWVSDLVRASDKPAIAAVNGVAAGGGLALALMCDMRIASDQAQFYSIFVRRALLPDTCATWFLPRLVGPSRALRMMWTGDVVDAEEAFRIGLVDQVVPHDQLMETALAFAERIASGPSVTIELTKRAVYRGLERDLQTHAEIEQYISTHFISRTQDVIEGRESFREKRPPRWIGR